MCAAKQDMVTVTVKQGSLRGRKVISQPGSTYYSFQGIPYARPPVGYRRFKRPEPPDSWSGIRNALVEGSACIHIDSIFKRIQGEEDCLYLNVYTPKLPGGYTPLKPVMVWIHGGGFHEGSGNTTIFGPDYLVHADVVLVTLNYRLGVLGFLCLNDTDVSGNNGLKDQVEALKWVQQNIAQFAGDPGNVTIFGESAGGACVHYHLLSPMSKGLFHRAIAQSGSALNPWAFTKSSRDPAFRLGKQLGCATDDARELVSFLRSVPSSSIIKAQDNVISAKEISFGLSFPFVPSLENDTPQAFLSESPVDLIKYGSIREVPFISGITTHEGIIHIAKNRATFMQKVDKNFKKLVPQDLVENRCPASEGEISNKIRQFYFKDGDVSERNILQYIDLLTDTHYGLGVYNTVKEHAASCASPVYYYQFAFDGQLGLFKRFFGLESIKGSCHTDDLGYLFYSIMNSTFLDKDAPEMKVLALMVQLWTSFAKNGIPQAEEVTWLPVTKSELHCLTIDHPPRSCTDPHKERMSFWTELYNESEHKTKP